MQNQELASLVLNTLGFIVKPQDITIRSEIGAGIHIRCTGEHRFDMEILDFQSQTTYDFELQNYNENLKLILVGNGKNFELVKEKVKLLDLENKVIMTGVRDDVNEILQTFDMFVFPSIYEGLPVSVIEAQASGLKCLLSDTVTKEVDITGNVEFMSLEKSPKEWAEKIVSMLPYERKNTQQKIIDAGYDIKSTAEWLTDFYIKLAEKN